VAREERALLRGEDRRRVRAGPVDVVSTDRNGHAARIREERLQRLLVQRADSLLGEGCHLPLPGLG
jgi:hypothetical protein